MKKTTLVVSRTPICVLPQVKQDNSFAYQQKNYQRAPGVKFTPNPHKQIVVSRQNHRTQQLRTLTKTLLVACAQSYHLVIWVNIVTVVSHTLAFVSSVFLCHTFVTCHAYALNKSL